MRIPASHRRVSSRPGRSWAAMVVCLALLALLSLMLIPHVHQTPSDAEHCALCITMHTAAPVAVAAAVVLIVQIGISTQVLKARPLVRYWQPQLFTRPPPQSL